MKIDAEETVGAFEHPLRAANAALGELHRNHRRLRGESGLQPFHQRGVTRHLMVAGDRAVDDAERAHHLLRRQAERPSGRRRRAEIPQQRGVDEAAFDDIDLDGDAEAAGHFEAGSDRRDQFGTRQLAAQLSCGDRGGHGRHARMQDGAIMRVVVVARMGHAAIDPGRVMGRELSAEHEHVGLGRTAPFPDEACDFGDRLGGRSRQRARQRIEDVGLDGLDDRGVELRGIDGRRKTRQIDHQIGCCDLYVTGGYSG